MALMIEDGVALRVERGSLQTGNLCSVVPNSVSPRLVNERLTSPQLLAIFNNFTFLFAVFGFWVCTVPN